MHIVGKHFEDVLETFAYVSFVQKKKAVTTTPHAPHPLELVVVS